MIISDVFMLVSVGCLVIEVRRSDVVKTECPSCDCPKKVSLADRNIGEIREELMLARYYRHYYQRIAQFSRDIADAHRLRAENRLRWPGLVERCVPREVHELSDTCTCESSRQVISTVNL